MFECRAAPQSSIYPWQGESGRWYYFYIYQLLAIPDLIGNCNYLFCRVRYDQSGVRQAIYIGEKGNTDRFASHEKLWPAIRLGATELHVCFDAKSRSDRLDIESDLRNGHATPLNAQPSRAAQQTGGLSALLGGIAVPVGGGIAHSVGDGIAAILGGGLPPLGLAAAVQPAESQNYLDLIEGRGVGLAPFGYFPPPY